MDQVRVATLAPWVLTPLHIWVEAKQASLLLAEVLRMRRQTDMDVRGGKLVHGGIVDWSCR